MGRPTATTSEQVAGRGAAGFHGYGGAAGNHGYGLLQVTGCKSSDGGHRVLGAHWKEDGNGRATSCSGVVIEQKRAVTQAEVARATGAAASGTKARAEG